MKQYISIDMTSMKNNKLTIEEWIFLENTHFLSNNKYQACFASKKTIAKYFSVSERKIYKIINTLEKKKFLKKTELKHLQVSDKWINIISKKNAYNMQKEENFAVKSTVDNVHKMHTKKDNSKRDIKLSLTRGEIFKNFNQFKNYCIDNFEDIEFNLEKGNPVGYLASTKLKIKNGYIYK